MQQWEAFHRQLRDHYAAIVAEFDRARHYLGLARAAQQAGNYTEVRKWVWRVRVLRMTAAEWRNRAQRITPIILCALWSLVGCGKVSTPPREFTASFEVQPSPDGSSIVWSLQFKSREQYHAFLDTTADGAERAKVRELVAAGMQLHHIIGCNTHEQAVTKLGNDGIAFVGSCPVQAHAVAAGGI